MIAIKIMPLVHRTMCVHKRTGDIYKVLDIFTKLEILTKGENISQKIFILDTNYLILSQACDLDSLLI